MRQRKADMNAAPQLRIPATYMRGGTSKGVFFRLQDLPKAAQQHGVARDALLMRIIGSPDPYGKHTDGMGGATSSTSKCVIISEASMPDHDVDYLYGQVAIDTAFVDWSGNCGNLSAAVGPFAIAHGMVDPASSIWKFYYIALTDQHTIYPIKDTICFRIISSVKK